ncbi:MAG: hypothetical protein JNK05_20785 [Myxococcales bacterium]|nr:hypothetical protein [Myxococcales bacterium]
MSHSDSASASGSTRFLSVVRSLAAVATVATAHCGTDVAPLSGGDGGPVDARAAEASAVDVAPSEALQDVCNGEWGVLQPAAVLLDGVTSSDGSCAFLMEGRVATDGEVYRHACSQPGLACEGSRLGVRCVAVACSDRPGEVRWYWRGSGGPLAPPEC